MLAAFTACAEFGEHVGFVPIEEPTTIPEHLAGRVSFRGTKAQPDEKLCEILRTLDTNTYVDASKMTLGEWLPKWLELAASEVRDRPLRASTISRYRNILDVRLVKSALARRSAPRR